MVEGQISQYSKVVKEDETITAIIQTKNSSKSYGKIQVLKNIDLTIEHGEFTASMGPSGSGKTTLMNTLSIIDTFDGGDVWIEGKSLLDMKNHSRPAKNFIYFLLQLTMSTQFNTCCDCKDSNPSWCSVCIESWI
jgi:ABC-type multidrug transport system ATPase subunit